MKTKDIKIDERIISGLNDALIKLANGLGTAYASAYVSRFIYLFKINSLIIKYSGRANQFGVKRYINQDNVIRHYYSSRQSVNNLISEYYKRKLK